MPVKDRIATRLRETPPSLLRAGSWAAVVTLTVTVIAGVAMWAVDRESFPNIARGLWWAAQTVTTVGYGDVVPVTPAGRAIAVVVMVTGLGFVTVMTGAIVSVFVSKLTRTLERREREELERTVAEIVARLERIEEAVRR